LAETERALTAERLAEIEQRLKAGRLAIDEADWVTADGDAYFAWLSAAPTDIADLLAEVKRQRRRAVGLKAALEYYADAEVAHCNDSETYQAAKP